MGIGSSRHSREGGDEHRPLLEGQSTTVGVGLSGRVPLDFASMSDEDRRNRLSKKPLKKRLGEFTHLHSKETPEENRARFFERNTDAIGKLRKEIQSIRSKNSLGIRTFKGIKDKIKDIEGSFVRHEHKRYLGQPREDYINLEKAYHDALNSFRLDDRVRLEKANMMFMNDAAQKKLSDVFEAADQYSGALEERLRSSNREEGSSST